MRVPYLIIIVLLIFSCRKEKLKDEKEKLLVGTWWLYITCNEKLGCVYASAQNYVIVYKNGTIEHYDQPNDKTYKARITNLEWVPDPVNKSPQVSYLFKATIKDKSMFNNAGRMSSYNYIRWTNGYFISAFRFEQHETIGFMKKSQGGSIGDQYFLKQ